MTYRFVVNYGGRRLAVRVQPGSGQHSRYVGKHDCFVGDDLMSNQVH